MRQGDEGQGDERGTIRVFVHMWAAEDESVCTV